MDDEEPQKFHVLTLAHMHVIMDHVYFTDMWMEQNNTKYGYHAGVAMSIKHHDMVKIGHLR